MKKHDFKGKNVLITGASSGIGRALAGEFAKRGANLGITGLPSEKKVLDDYAKELKGEYGIDVWTFPVDLIEKGAPEKLHKDVMKKMGEVYALVNNAGTLCYGNSWEIDWELQMKTFTLNLYVPMRMTYLFVGDMVKRGSGVVFNTCSVSSFQPVPFKNMYGMAKAGLLSWSRGIRVELKGTGVTVCTLNPPYADTALLKGDGIPKKIRAYWITGLVTPEWVARKAIRAFEKGKFLYVPGIYAKFIHLVLIKHSPRRFVDFCFYHLLKGKKGGEVF
jgi:short-subunit dehydrogenase